MEYLSKNFNNQAYRVAVFGGSFDPPTLGHQSVIEQLIPLVDEIVLVPSIAHAFGKNLTPYVARLKMLTLFLEDLFESHPDFKTKVHILNIEPDLIPLHETGYVYTYDVLEKVEQLYQEKKAEIGFVIGPDLAKPTVFNQFYRAQELKKKWPIIVVEQKLFVRSTYVRAYITENAAKIPPETLARQLENSLGFRLTADIIEHKRYFPEITFFKTQLELAIFSIQQDALCVLVHNGVSNGLPYASINIREDKVLEDALNRSILAQLGHLPSYYEQVITQGNRKNKEDEWCLTITYFCLLPRVVVDKAFMSRWVKVTDFMLEAVSEGQKNSLLLCVERLKNKASYTSIPCYLALEPFTLSELQKIYEIVLGHKLEKKSFRRRFIESGLLEDTGQIRKANHRPAQLYRLNMQSHTPYYFTRIIEGSRT